MINRIKDDRNIPFKTNIILHFLKYCSRYKLEPKNLENIDLNKAAGKAILDEDSLILSDEIDNLTFQNEREKNKLINLIVNIYASFNPNYLIKLFESKNGNQCSKALLDLLNNKEIK